MKQRAKPEKKFSKETQAEIKRKQNAIKRLHRILIIVKLGIFLGVLYLIFVKLHN